MFKREMKVNFKSFLIWLFILMGIFLVVFLVYPSIINSDSIQLMDEMMEMFPPEMLKAFNMDLSSIDTVFGWLKSEGFIFVLLIVGFYSAILGSNILLKEENDKTIEYLSTLPITRNKIIFDKIMVGLIYITLLVFLSGIFNLVGLSLSGDFNLKQYLILSITPLFPSISIYFICLFLSTLTHKTKKMFGLSLGIVLFSYVLQIVSALDKSTEFLKYFSVFTLADIRNVIVNVSINPIMIFITVFISFTLLILTVIRYNKKELI